MGWDDFVKGANTFFSGGYNNEINAALTPKCETTNQGSTMDDIRTEIVNINNIVLILLCRMRRHSSFLSKE